MKTNWLQKNITVIHWYEWVNKVKGTRIINIVSIKKKNNLKSTSFRLFIIFFKFFKFILIFIHGWPIFYGQNTADFVS